jgi:hypothetical protein
MTTQHNLFSSVSRDSPFTYSICVNRCSWPSGTWTSTWRTTTGWTSTKSPANRYVLAHHKMNVNKYVILVRFKFTVINILLKFTRTTVRLQFHSIFLVLVCLRSLKVLRLKNYGCTKYTVIRLIKPRQRTINTGNLICLNCV